MNSVSKTCVLALSLVALSAGSAMADVKTRDKSQVKFEGFLGGMVGMFGGKAAREGVVITNAVKGDRKVELNDTTGRIVDLKEEKVYELDMKNKTYKVTTFDELRRRMREAQEKAQKETPKQEQPQQQQEQGKPAREMEVDFDVKETGQTKQLAGYSTREVVMTVTVREKGKTLEESGGAVMTSNSWMAPAIPAMNELAQFEMRYWKAIAPEASGVSAEQMAAAMVMYPMLKNAMERLKAEGSKLEGTPLGHDHRVRSREKQRADGRAGSAVGRRRARRHARAQDGQAR